MGGSKNKSPAQKEKTQKRDEETKKSKSKKSGKSDKIKILVEINESDAIKFIKDSKMITAHELARQTGSKVSIANSFLQKSLKVGIIKKIGGFSGHHIYQPVSE